MWELTIHGGYFDVIVPLKKARLTALKDVKNPQVHSQIVSKYSQRESECLDQHCRSFEKRFKHLSKKGLIRYNKSHIEVC